jgi:hypothetical protein
MAQIAFSAFLIFTVIILAVTSATQEAPQGKVMNRFESLKNVKLIGIF